MKVPEHGLPDKCDETQGFESAKCKFFKKGVIMWDVVSEFCSDVFNFSSSRQIRVAFSLEVSQNMK